jgi:glycosyltransferase involved in cell wall biosynthesis
VQGLASEIVVLDSGSTDATRAIAAEAGARVFHQDWLGYRDQKNAALLKCTGPWVLALDADEELSPALRSEIELFFQSGDCDRWHGASFPRKVWFLGRWITHGDWYPDRKLRLVRREGARWAGSPEHDFLETPGPVTRFRSDLHHYSFPDTATFIRKINIFADEYLKRELAAGRQWSLAGTVTRPLWRFFRGYILRRGFLDGFPGLWIAVGVAFQTFVRHSRTYEARVAGRSPGAVQE